MCLYVYIHCQEESDCSGWGVGWRQAKGALNGATPIAFYIIYTYNITYCSILLAELPSQPLGRAFAVAHARAQLLLLKRLLAAFGIAAAVVYLASNTLNLLLTSFRRRHLRGVLLSPLCPSILEPYLQHNDATARFNFKLSHQLV